MVADCCIESILWRRGVTRIAGLDEAGRGAWAGPVVAGAVILPADTSVIAELLRPRAGYPGLRDSKQLSRGQREAALPFIREQALAVGIGIVPADVVDEFGISCAGQLAFWRALDALLSEPEFVLVDGFPLWTNRFRQLAVIDGDAASASIAAASIVAKVTRDALMADLDLALPGYGFAQHCGYGTSNHQRALAQHGPSSQHRTSYGPIAGLGQAPRE